MNGLFRTSRENENIDYGEESEDEEMFQNTSLDKYVDLKKECKMHCVYQTKFRKWVPISVVDPNAPLNKTGDFLFSKDVDNNQRSYHQNSYQKKPYQKPYQQRSYQRPDHQSYQKTPYQRPDQQRSYQRPDGPTCYKPKTNYYSKQAN